MWAPSRNPHVPTFFIAPLNFISLIKCLCEKVEAKVTVSLSVPFAAQLASLASEWCWASVGQHGPRTDHSFNLGSMSAQKLLHCGPLAHCTPLKKMPPLSFYWDLRDTELVLVFCFLSPISQHTVCYLRDSYRTLSSTHMSPEKAGLQVPCQCGNTMLLWSSWCLMLAGLCQGTSEDDGSLCLGSEPPFLTFSQECGFIMVSTLPPLPSETLVCFEGNESHMFLIHLHVAHQNVVL